MLSQKNYQNICTAIEIINKKYPWTGWYGHVTKTEIAIHEFGLGLELSFDLRRRIIISQSIALQYLRTMQQYPDFAASESANNFGSYPNIMKQFGEGENRLPRLGKLVGRSCYYTYLLYRMKRKNALESV